MHFQPPNNAKRPRPHHPPPHESPQNFGFVPNGTGGGSAVPPSSRFFGGGGGAAGFFPRPLVVGDGGGLAFDPEARLLILPVMLYFWLKALALVRAAATWSPCRSRKLLAVEAALRASEKETCDGSLWSLFAVLRAACFSAHVVPDVAGAGADEDEDEEVLIPAKRDCSSLSCELFRAGAGGADIDVGDCVRRGGTGGDALRPISKPGTATPA